MNTLLKRLFAQYRIAFVDADGVVDQLIYAWTLKDARSWIQCARSDHEVILYSRSGRLMFIRAARGRAISGVMRKRG